MTSNHVQAFSEAQLNTSSLSEQEPEPQAMTAKMEMKWVLELIKPN